MADLETSSPAAAYLTKPNILVPKVHAGGSTDIVARGELDIESRLGLTTAGRDAPIAGSTIGASTADRSVVVVEALKGTGALNEIQTIVVSPASSGTFTLTFGANTTPPMPANETAANVQVALRALASVGGANVNVVAGPQAGSYVVTFIGALALTDVAMISGDATKLVNVQSPTQET